MLYRYPALRTSETSSGAVGSCICCGIAIVFLSVFLFCVFLTFLPFRWAPVATAVVAVLFICTACWCWLAPADSAGTSSHRGRRTAATAAVAPQDALHPPATAACLQTFEYEKALGTSGRAGGSCEMCAVCIGVLQGGEMVRQVPACEHVFHVGCIDAWLYSHTTCPLCRAEIKPRRSAESEESSAPPLPPV